MSDMLAINAPQLSFFSNCVFVWLRCGNMLYEFHFTLSTRWTRHLCAGGADAVRGHSIAAKVLYRIHVFVPSIIQAECLRQIEWSFVLIKWKINKKIKNLFESYEYRWKTMFNALQPNRYLNGAYFLSCFFFSFCIPSLSTLCQVMCFGMFNRANDTHRKFFKSHKVDSNIEFTFDGDDCDRKRNH